MGQWLKALQLTDEKLEIIDECLSKGMFEKHVYPLVGVAKSTWYNWKKEARALEERLNNDEELIEELPDDDIKLLRFLDLCERGRSVAIEKNIDNIIKAGETEWRASAWFLERLDNEKFGSKQNVAVSGAVGVVDIQLTEDEEAQFKANMASIGLGEKDEK